MERRVSVILTVFLVLALPHRQGNVPVGAAFVCGVNHRDVEGLGNLVDWFPTLNTSFGNPCLEGANWDWVECCTDDPPRITALDLNSYSLSGTIPDFSTMDALEKIDMRNNYLKGKIPSFLGKLPNLKRLNLSNNYFTGLVPSSLTENEGEISLDINGNPDLCSTSFVCTNIHTPSTFRDLAESPSDSDYSYESPSDSEYSEDIDSDYSEESPSSKKSNKLKLVLAIVIPIFVLFWVVLGVCCVLHHKKKSADSLAALNAGTQGGNNVQPTYGTTAQDMANGMVVMGQMVQTVNNEYKNQMNVVEQYNARNYHQTFGEKFSSQPLEIKHTSQASAPII